MERISTFEEYQTAYTQSVENPDLFWGNIAQKFIWKKKWDTVLQWDFEAADSRWFLGGQLNITENILERNLLERPDQTAILWESNRPETASRAITYSELAGHVCRAANVLKKHGIQKGDRVCLYMPMIPELAFAVLACARIGAVHSVVFAGFSATALADRINDSACKAVITVNSMERGDKTIGVKEIVDKALESCPSVKMVLVKQHPDEENLQDDHYYDWDKETREQPDFCPAETMDSEDPLFILYTSGSTGKPKGVLHTCAGYMVYTEYTFRNVFQYDPGDVFWCTADIGWVTGHSYIVYGPLLAGATTLMFEGIPTFPDAGRFWETIDKHKVNRFYTAPTAIRSLMAAGDEFIKKHDLSSLKMLGSVGEPINEEAWHWYHQNIGKGKLPIVDTWWQTETGGVLISNLAGVTPHKPGYATLPLPGVQPVLLDPQGNEILENEKEGLLCIKFPWPSIIRTTYGDHERCRQTYFAPFKGYYFTGDGARRDADGMYRIIGRVDDVINVSGHRFGTAEIENAINEHPSVVESAVVGYPHDIKGQGIYAYVICKKGVGRDDKLRMEIIQTASEIIGKIAKPDKIQFVSGLPKTRSGKIMRRILRKVAAGETGGFGDVSTLLDPGIVNEIVSGAF